MPGDPAHTSSDARPDARPAEPWQPGAVIRSGPEPPVPRWVAPTFALLALALVPWIGYLAAALSPTQRTVHYRAAWVGFDVLLLLTLAGTAWYAWRGSPRVALLATAAATLLVVDAWFDLLTTPPGTDLVVAALSAALVELPLAAVCVWLATHTAQVLRRRTERLARRARRAERQLSDG
jgi:hypothetical protein